MKKLNSRGMTLVELIVTMVISAILLSSMGALLIATSYLWTKTSDTARAQHELRYTRTRMENYLRMATTDPVTISGGGDSIAFTYIKPFRRSDFDFPLDQSVRRIEKSGSSLIARDGGGAVAERLMENVESFNVSLITGALNPNATDCAYVVTIVQAVPSKDGSVIRSSSTFTVKSFNRGL